MRFAQSLELVLEELRRRGVEVTFGSLAVEPFRGLVARDVRVYDSPQRLRTLARVNEVIVEGNYANAVRGNLFVDSLTLVDAALDGPEILAPAARPIFGKSKPYPPSPRPALAARSVAPRGGRAARSQSHGYQKPPHPAD